MLEQSGDGKVMYEGEPRKCMAAKEEMELKEVRRMVKKITESDLSEYKLRCNLKYDRQILMSCEGDTDVRMIFKGNYEHNSLYVDGDDSPRRRVKRWNGLPTTRVMFTLVSNELSGVYVVHFTYWIGNAYKRALLCVFVMNDHVQITALITPILSTNNI
ncbi:hypothetical protein Cgig2_029987 [Carnegiea gigantea]|uniref:Uncharacterized protein n=1 Tax=Carnegiea gigantea TaxID=171969 RepID=A0A9Q1K7X8_9CARY|nr:hypothetical protein Cgig2_029987 [Carnegiea gigantea]